MQFKEKWFCCHPDALITELVPVPAAVMDYYKTVTLFMGTMYVDKLPFLVSVSQHIHYSTGYAVELIKIPVLENNVKRIIKIYGLH